MDDPVLVPERSLFEAQARFCRIIGNPTRLLIVHLLRDGELCVNDLARQLDTLQPTVSQHLSILRNAGVLQSRRDGTQRYYRLIRPEIAEICDMVRALLRHDARDRSQLFADPPSPEVPAPGREA